MQTFCGYQDIPGNPRGPLSSGSIVTIGNFDGVHRGHQALIALAREHAKKRNLPLVVYTFRPHPRAVLKPGASVPMLLTFDERLEHLSKLGTDIVVQEPFTREFSSLEPHQFFERVLADALQARAIIVGHDFGFGKNRGGDFASLKSWADARGIAVEQMLGFRLKEGNEEILISSSEIRRLLLAYEIETANDLLGYPFFKRGVVKHGDGRGRTIGFPTANLTSDEKLELPRGVYCTETLFRDKLFPSVTNVGFRPTFQQDGTPGAASVLVETHLLDQDIDLYGYTIEVRFLKFVRPEKKFPSIGDLKTQITADCGEARSFFLGRKPSSA